MHRDPKMALKMCDPTLEISNCTCTFRSQLENCIIKLAIMLDWGCCRGGCGKIGGDILMMVTRNNLVQHKVIILKTIAIPKPTSHTHSTWKVRPLGSLHSPPPFFLEYNWTKSWWQQWSRSTPLQSTRT